MLLTREDIEGIDRRAHDVGTKIGWDLRFVVLHDPDLVGLAVGDDGVVVLGPGRLTNLMAHEVDFALEDLASGSRRIAVAADERVEAGVPRLV